MGVIYNYHMADIYIYIYIYIYIWHLYITAIWQLYLAYRGGSAPPDPPVWRLRRGVHIPVIYNCHMAVIYNCHMAAIYSCHMAVIYNRHMAVIYNWYMDAAPEAPNRGVRWGGAPPVSQI